MINNFLENILPKSSFVEFSAQKLTSAKIVWSNPYGISPPDLDEHAFYIPIDGDHPSASSAKDIKLFLGERYGGVGVTSNGGGARCGLRNSIQIKGIGKNPLAGSATSFWHSYGGESLAGGIREAIWSEISHSALPHGAVRIHGLIDTGTRVPAFSSAEGTSETTRRGLTIREAALRPGHFVRSLYFSRHDEARYGMASDAERTRAAVVALAQASDAAPFLSNSNHQLNSLLIAMVERFADQHAAATAKRLSHGLQSPSNMCMDGRWIDFGTASSVSDYGKIIVAKHGVPFGEDSQIKNTINEIVLSIQRYLPNEKKRFLVPPNDILSIFSKKLSDSIQLEFLKLTGIPAWDLLSIDNHLTKSAFSCFKKIILKGNSEPFKLYPACAGQDAFMPEKMGSYSLNSLIRLISLCKNKQQAEISLSQELNDIRLLHEFIDSYWNLRDACLFKKNPAERNSAHLFIKINSLRINQGTPDLYRHTLDRTIDMHVASGLDSKDFINNIINKNKISLSDPIDGNIDLSAWIGKGSIFSETMAPLLVKNVDQENKLINYFQNRTSNDDEKNLMKKLCETVF
ncbi:hypothetical protein [Janthinobacterium sp. SUN206]|uniref:hypothetical protein n=1 Tax=Janthinobacterium sp. SUN206 TaxID=3014787 RepID=UPI0027126542|nr:hypothetical protein [Janthinobacterium sp. SUN206]MDO8068936.1 hypothetical protein [Janthinobacterium sp. SUN206]